MSMLYRIAERVLNRPLLILPEKAAAVVGVLAGRIGIDGAALQSVIDNLDEQPAPDASRFVGEDYERDEAGKPRGWLPYRRTADGAAVITISGSLVNRGAWIGARSGLVSYEGIKHQVQSAARDAVVSSIVLDIDSAGGEAVGAFETAEVVRAAAKEKNVIAVVNGIAASAAYAIASGARRIVTTATGISGSIGVVLLHADYSRFLDMKGIEPTLIFAGAHKVDGNPFERLPEGVRKSLQAEVDRFYDLFVATVATGRAGMTPDAIRATEARTYIGADAVAAGIADAVGTFESVLDDVARLRTAKPQKSQPRRTMMTTETTEQAAPQGIPQSQHDAAVRAARAEGRTEGVAAERERISAILACDEARERNAQALAIALTGATLEQAKAVLAVSPIERKEPAKQEAPKRAETAPLGLVADDATNKPAVASAWEKSLSRAGAKLS